MEIPIGRKYVITSDPLCYIVNERAKYNKGKNKGKEYLRPFAYYGSIEGCLKCIMELKIRKSEATTLKELLNDIEKINKFIKDQFKKVKK